MAEWEGAPDGPPQSSSGEFIFDVTAVYTCELIFAAQYLLAEAVLDTLASLDTPDGFIIDGDIISIWDGETIEITFEGHDVFADGGIFDFTGMVLEDLEHYFGDGPNPYDDQQHYPEGITVTVDPGSELEPIPRAAVPFYILGRHS